MGQARVGRAAARCSWWSSRWRRSRFFREIAELEGIVKKLEDGENCFAFVPSFPTRTCAFGAVVRLGTTEVQPLGSTSAAPGRATVYRAFQVGIGEAREQTASATI